MTTLFELKLQLDKARAEMHAAGTRYADAQYRLSLKQQEYLDAALKDLEAKAQS